MIDRKRQLLTSLSQLETSENTTFIIQSTVRAAAGVETVSIASGVSLVFDGGMIAGALTGNTDNPEAALKLVGNFTSVEAPITQIFGDTVTASGYWHIDRAYPQWFDAVVGTQSYNTGDPHDCSVAINKAVEMKMSGEVFLPAGVYLVSHTIRLRHGINLIGDSATQTKVGKNHIPDPDMADGWGRATFIIPFFKEGRDAFVSNHINGPGGAAVVAVNIKRLAETTKSSGLNPSTGDEKPIADIDYALPMGSVEHIYFYNTNSRIGNGGETECAHISQKVCCLVAGAFSFRDVMWRNFCRAIKWTEEYNDSKTMYRCYVETTFREEVVKEFGTPDELPYLIDIRGCGDAMVIEDCHIDRGVYEVEKDNQKTEVQLYKAIAMRTCLGGSIRNSIIHGDIDIEHCTALEFADNHCEFGMQMSIRWSQISIHDNFIEKGRVPNFVIHAMDGGSEGNANYGVVNFSDNKFVCYNNIGDRPFVEKASEYDILLKTRKGVAPYSIDLSRNYRVTANSDTVSFHPTGIMLGTQDTDGNGVASDIQPFTAFNGHSYFLSDYASIRRNLKLKQSNMVPTVPALTIDAMDNDNIPKTPDTTVGASSGNVTVQFKARVIIDAARGIMGHEIDIPMSPYTDDTALDYSYKGQTCGILFSLGWNEGEEASCLLQIIRSTIRGAKVLVDTVTVPVCGARFLHDNSVSVEGHLWKRVSSSSTSIVSCTNSGLSLIEFHDDNVTCQAPACPEGRWRQGDIVFNTTEPTERTPQPGFWIKGSSGWIAR